MKMRLWQLKGIVVSLRQQLQRPRLHRSWREAIRIDKQYYQSEIALIERGLGIGQNVDIDIERKKYDG